MKNFVLQCFLAFVIIVSFLAVVLIWIFHPPSGDPSAMAVLNTLVGSLAAAFGMVVSYFFGSSSGSSAKDDTINTMIGKAAPLTNGDQARTTVTTTDPTTTVTTTDPHAVAEQRT